MEIVDGKPYMDQVKNLIIEYTKKLGRDLTFQNIDDELEDFAGKYIESEGELLVVIIPLQSAIHLCRKFGFVECEPYYNNPMNDVIYMKKKL